GIRRVRLLVRGRFVHGLRAILRGGRRLLRHGRHLLRGGGQGQQAGEGERQQAGAHAGLRRGDRGGTALSGAGSIMPSARTAAVQRFCSQALGSTGLPSRRSSKYSAARPWPPEVPTVDTASPRRTRSPGPLSRLSLWAYRLM